LEFSQHRQLSIRLASLWGDHLELFLDSPSIGSWGTGLSLPPCPTGGGQPNISGDIIKRVRLTVPPLDEQNRIVTFLDQETAKIDALIAKKERLIELLQEKRTALISHAVTKGLDSTVPMKDSGDKWIGVIPSHWTPKKLKHLFRFAKRQNYPDLTVLSVYRDYGVIEKNTRDDNHNRTPEDLSTYQLVNVGDLVINKMKAWQGSLGISSLHGITSPDYVVYRSTNKEHLPYLHHRLRIPSMAATFHCISNGIRPDQWRLEPEKFEQLWLYMPPVDEQKRICDYIDKQVAAIDMLRAKVRDGIEKLREYRTALISAAVTGKIDVREGVV
jgi:type I restriction enzyme S subunit